MPFKSPMEVIPIWMVDRKRVGSSASFTAAVAEGVSLLRERREPRPARGEQRHLGHREDAVQEDQARQYRELHGLPRWLNVTSR